MNRLVIGGLAAACVGLGTYLVLARKDAPPADTPVLSVPAVPPPPECPPAPTVLADVIELADIDPLLDPGARPQTGVPFDESPAVPAVAMPDPPFIPPIAEDGPAIAPSPRGVTDASRTLWYGEHRLPRQIGGGMTPAELEREIDAYNLRFPRAPVYGRGVVVGVGYFF